MLCLLILAAFAPMVYAAPTTITELYANYTVPAGGEEFDFDSVTVPSDAHYTAEIYSVYYYDSSSGGYVTISDGDTVIAGVKYAVRVKFIADSGYAIAAENKADFYINGEKAAYFGGVNIPETYFVAAGETPSTPDEPTPVKVTFWQKIVNFFQKIRNFIRRIFVK